MTDMVLSTGASHFLPAVSIALIKERREFIAQAYREVMQPGHHYGVIPGTDGKPSLLKPGAETICSFFGLVPQFEVVRSIEDWTGIDHHGEPLFYYCYRCSLYRDGILIANAEGSANSWEKKHRMRNAGRKCPSCGQPAITQSRDGGFFCWPKKGGCNAKFAENDAAITSQVAGYVPNPDVFDLVNTLQKMASKRALVAVALIATAASEFFTQDVEDHPDADEIAGKDDYANRYDRQAGARQEPARKSSSPPKGSASDPAQTAKAAPAPVPPAYAGMTDADIRRKILALLPKLGYELKTDAFKAQCEILGRQPEKWDTPVLIEILEAAMAKLPGAPVDVASEPVQATNAPAVEAPAAEATTETASEPEALSYAESKRLFTERCDRSDVRDRKKQGEIASMLLGHTPAKWTASIWITLYKCHDSMFDAAVAHILSNPDEAVEGGDPFADSPTAQSGAEVAVLDAVSETTPSLTAAQVEAMFRERCVKAGVIDRKEQSKIALILLGEKPARWTGAVWLKCFDASEDALYQAVADIVDEAPATGSDPFADEARAEQAAA